MVCLNCRKRTNCKRPCPALKEQLREFNYYQRETPVDPMELDMLFADPGLESEPLLEGLNLDDLLALLPVPARQIIISHFLQGRSLASLAGYLKMPVKRVKDLCRAALQTMKTGALLKKMKMELCLPRVARGKKGGYNKKTAHAKRKGKKTGRAPRVEQGAAQGEIQAGHLPEDCREGNGQARSGPGAS